MSTQMGTQKGGGGTYALPSSARTMMCDSPHASATTFLPPSTLTRFAPTIPALWYRLRSPHRYTSPSEEQAPRSCTGGGE
jgi:hypothetical protein